MSTRKIQTERTPYVKTCEASQVNQAERMFSQQVTALTPDKNEKKYPWTVWQLNLGQL